MLGKLGVRAGKISNKKKIARERILKGKKDEIPLNVVFYNSPATFILTI
jgi:hypothetical protein